MGADVVAAPAGLKGRLHGWLKGAVGMFLGVGSGVVLMYSNAIVDQVVKPTKPLANFSATSEGLLVTCQSLATGDSGWWDFGDGSPLEPFDATQPTLTHAYPKPGKYAVKLTVRNFLNEENDRAVDLDLTRPPAALSPSITKLRVDPLGGAAVAPAGFRLTGEVQGAEKIILDLGADKPLIVDTANGPFERLFVIDKPGDHDIRVTGLANTTAVRDAARVHVDAPAVGSVSAVAQVIDTCTTVTARTGETKVPVAAPAKPGAFEKTISVERGQLLSEVSIAKSTSAAVKNVKVAINADKKTAKVTGEWAGAPEKSAKGAPTDAVIVVAWKCEPKTATFANPVSSASAAFVQGAATLALPPLPLASATGGTWQRRVQLTVRESTAAGPAELLKVDALPPAWQGPATRPGAPIQFSTQTDAGKLTVRMTRR